MHTHISWVYIYFSALFFILDSDFSLRFSIFRSLADKPAILISAIAGVGGIELVVVVVAVVVAGEVDVVEVEGDGTGVCFSFLERVSKSASSRRSTMIKHEVIMVI